MKTLKNLPFLKLHWWTEDACLRMNVLLFTIFFFFAFLLLGGLDFASTTANDFAPLYDQKDIILNDPSSVYQMHNVTITISEKDVQYVLNTRRCSLSFLQNKETKEVSNVTELSNTNGIIDLAAILFLSFCLGAILAFVISLIICCFDPYRLIKNKIKTIFS